MRERGPRRVRIVDLRADDDQQTQRAAALLVEGFREHWPAAWPDLDSARREVVEMLAPDCLCRAALDEDGRLVGWIGGIPGYDGRVWELHPLVVDQGRRMQGIGRALVEDLELLVAERGALTLWLGTDDEDFMTSLAGCDLYDDLPARIATFRNLKGHPAGFYLKLGFRIMGVVPDANGVGKPDILMAKRVAPTPGPRGSS